MSMEQSISLEETNKIRISLGLKPLTDDKAPEDKEKVAEDNYAKVREQEVKDRETKKIQDRIAKVRNRRELNSSLKGATLGDADGEDDTLKWIKRSKKKEKELAKKRQQELEEMDKAAQDEYSERDLAGLKVSHDFDDLGEGEDRILTLKDSRILDNEEDELQNFEMAEEERRKKNQDLRIKRREYTGYDDDEFVEGAQGLMKRSILSKYDEEIEGSKQTEFRLGSSTTVSKKSKQEAELQQAAAAVNKSLLSIDYAKNLETADYVKEGDVGFKKPKTKKKRPSRRAALEADEDTMDVDAKQVPISRDLEANFVDDDDLQAALARSRKAKLRKSNKLTPEELAKRIAEQRLQETVETQEAEDAEGSGLVFDETSEFVQSVGLNPVVKPKQEPREVRLPQAQDARPSARSQSRDASLAPGDVPMSELEAGEVQVKEENEEEFDMEMLDAIEETFQELDGDVKKEEEEADLGVGTSSEQNFSAGMAATLNILKQQGVIHGVTSEQQQRENTQKQRDLWLAEQRFKIAKRELEKHQSRGGANRDQAQREYDNRLRELQEKRQAQDDFNGSYKPDVNIVYYDEFGRELTVKEAWKALSHKFHGKGSGKMKTEKRLKKIADEKKKLAMASGDTPLSMNRAFQQRQEKLGQAHFILSVGNRGAIPQAGDFMETQPLQKGKTEKAKKKKEGKGQQQPEAGFMTLPAPAIQAVTNGGSGPGSLAGSPAPRAGFSRISSTPVDTPSQSNGGTPGPTDRIKVTFGLKRKAGEELAGSPPPKRR
ncbi:SART-1 protein [Coprinopsis marcescibilis]|uniref:SART-1 protein n=1 Tax=Coprinopsis marcescibilis TaxID=230819 RepID=A0A5C3L5X9_COPMA|nr:SART-1 protein [Coprinopsis marcescibilis]